MNGEIAQIVSLACHGNALLRGLAIQPFLELSASQYCEWIRFMEPRRRLLGMRNVQVAASPDEWLAQLRRTEADRITVGRTDQNHPLISDRMSAGLSGGGGTWYLQVRTPRGGQTWSAHWSIGNREAEDRRIWRVEYARVVDLPDPVVIDLAIATSQLREAVRHIRDFAIDQQCGFVDFFDRSLRSLDHDEPAKYYADVSPSLLLSPEAKRLLSASQNAWVFGAMGSWNDMFFEGDVQDRYEAVSEELFTAINRAIPAAVNSV